MNGSNGCQSRVIYCNCVCYEIRVPNHDMSSVNSFSINFRWTTAISLDLAILRVSSRDQKTWFDGKKSLAQGHSRHFGCSTRTFLSLFPHSEFESISQPLFSVLSRISLHLRSETPAQLQWGSFFSSSSMLCNAARLLLGFATLLPAAKLQLSLFLCYVLQCSLVSVLFRFRGLEIWNWWLTCSCFKLIISCVNVLLWVMTYEHLRFRYLVIYAWF